MAANQGWYSEWFADGQFPPVWFAPADDEHLTEEERYRLDDAGGAHPAREERRLYRIGKRLYELSPYELADLLNRFNLSLKKVKKVKKTKRVEKALEAAKEQKDEQGISYVPLEVVLYQAPRIVYQAIPDMTAKAIRKRMEQLEEETVELLLWAA